MLDVHPPEGKMHGFKDFALHLFTITVGLLIALGLEGCVERIHQHHLRDEADQNLRQEIRDNAKDLATTRTAVEGEKKNLVEVLKFLQARSENKPYDIHQISLNFTTSTLSDASWRTATATGSLNFMDYTRVQQFASAYQEQELFTRLQLETIDNYLQLQSYVAYGFDPNKVTPEEAKSAVPDVRRTLTHLVAMDQVAEVTREAYDKALTGKE
jgi:hypothetical protein